MSRLGTIAAALALAGITPGPAAASRLVSVGSGNDSPTLQTSVPLRVSGQLTVQFQGDAAAGCARWGLCGYSGTVSWRPAANASLIVSQTPGHRSTTVIEVPSFLAGPGLPGGVTNADVAFGAAPSAPTASHCADVADTGQFVPLLVRADRVTVALARAVPGLLLTRCAGPRDGDVIPQLPRRSLSVAALRRGRTTISLVASRRLSAHGFTGSINSTIVLHLGAPGRTTRSASPSHVRPGTGTRIRQIKVRYRATLSGDVVERVHGAANPLLCAPLGSCGLAGTITLTPRAGDARATLTAQERASRPRQTLLAAVGLARGPAPGVIGFGAVQWHGAGSMAVALTQGSEHCVDAARLGSGSLLMATNRGRLAVSYTPGALIGDVSAASHCPGPLFNEAVAAAGHIPVSMLARGTTMIRLTQGFTTTDDGYAVRFVPDLTLTLTPISRRTTTVTLPPGEFPLRRAQTR